LVGTDCDVTLSWNANVEPDLGGYEIAYQRYGTSTWLTKAVSAASTSDTITGLAHNVQYTFKIRARDLKSNWSNYTSTVAATPRDQTPPGQPVGLTAAPSDRSVVLSWSANTEPDLAGYQVDFRKTGASTWSNVAVAKTATSYTVSSLINGAEYEFRLRAKDTTGNWSVYSDVVRAVPGLA